MEIALFVTCVNNALFPSTGRAVVTVLERLGHRVTFPQPQTCCGQLHLNAGYAPEGLALARRTIATLAASEVILVPSASCAATMRHLWAQVAADRHDDALAAEAQELATRVYELSELLVDVLGVTDVGARFPYRVAYHPTCHSLRSLRVGDRPLRLLQAVQDLELVDFDGTESCCGFGGLFSVKNSETSVAMGQAKVDSVNRAGVDVLCAVDNSCLTHLGQLRAAHPPRVLHLAEILASGREAG